MNRAVPGTPPRSSSAAPDGDAAQTAFFCDELLPPAPVRPSFAPASDRATARQSAHPVTLVTAMRVGKPPRGDFVRPMRAQFVWYNRSHDADPFVFLG